MIEMKETEPGRILLSNNEEMLKSSALLCAALQFFLRSLSIAQVTNPAIARPKTTAMIRRKSTIIKLYQRRFAFSFSYCRLLTITQIKAATLTATNNNKTAIMEKNILALSRHSLKFQPATSTALQTGQLGI